MSGNERVAHNLPQLHHVARVIEVCTLPSEFLISTSELGGGEDATKTDLRRNNIYIYNITYRQQYRAARVEADWFD